jgi:hypothetical protein
VPSTKVSEQKAMTSAICRAPTPAPEYIRKRIEPPDSAANPTLWPTALAAKDAAAVVVHGTVALT